MASQVFDQLVPMPTATRDWWKVSQVQPRKSLVGSHNISAFGTGRLGLGGEAKVEHLTPQGKILLGTVPGFPDTAIAPIQTEDLG
jgi:hypothetical protein